MTCRSENVGVNLGEFDTAPVWIPDAAQLNNDFAATGQPGQAGEANN